MRRIVTFPCEGDTLVGTLDMTHHDGAGLLIVSGGNELRCGAHRGMALLADHLASAHIPTFRYDRRGIGDSTGTNQGYESSAADIAAATEAFRKEAGLAEVVAFGNCDAATALALFHASARIDALVLSNPWPGPSSDGLPASASIKARYAARVRDPKEWLRLIRGGVNLRKLGKGLLKVSATSSEDRTVVDRMAGALAASSLAATILIAERDNTGAGFVEAWNKCARAPDIPIQLLDSASHSYASNADALWLYDRLHEVARYSAA